MIHPDIAQLLTSLLVTASGVLLTIYLQPKAKLVWAEHRNFVHVLPSATPGQDSIPIYTRTIYVQNLGRQAAKDVEIIFNWKPAHFEIWPIVPYSDILLQDSRYVIRLATLGPKEWLNLELVGLTELPMTLKLRGVDVGEAKLISMSPVRVFPKAVSYLLVALMTFGVFSIVQFAISAIWPLLFVQS